MSRFLQELLCEMLADRQAYATITSARHTYALRRKTMAVLLERFGLETIPGSGFNMWLPVRDPVAARRILVQEHIRVADGDRFLPEFRVSGSGDGRHAGRDDTKRIIGGAMLDDGGMADGAGKGEALSKSLAGAVIAQDCAMRVTVSQPDAISERVAQSLAWAATA